MGAPTGAEGTAFLWYKADLTRSPSSCDCRFAESNFQWETYFPHLKETLTPSTWFFPFTTVTSLDCPVALCSTCAPL